MHSSERGRLGMDMSVTAEASKKGKGAQERIVSQQSNQDVAIGDERRHITTLEQ